MKAGFFRTNINVEWLGCCFKKRQEILEALTPVLYHIECVPRELLYKFHMGRIVSQPSAAAYECNPLRGHGEIMWWFRESGGVQGGVVLGRGW